jgi:hypothetical protein
MAPRRSRDGPAARETRRVPGTVISGVISEFPFSQIIIPFLSFLALPPLIAASNLASPVLTMIFKPRRPLHFE